MKVVNDVHSWDCVDRLKSRLDKGVFDQSDSKGAESILLPFYLPPSAPGPCGIGGFWCLQSRLGERGGTPSTGERSGGWKDLDRAVKWKEGGGERASRRGGGRTKVEERGC